MDDQELARIRTSSVEGDQNTSHNLPPPEVWLMNDEHIADIFLQNSVRDILTFYLIALPEGARRDVSLIPVLSPKQLEESYGGCDRMFITCVPFKSHFETLDATTESTNQALNIFQWSESFGLTAAQLMVLICDPFLSAFGGDLPDEDTAKGYLTDGLDGDVETVDITDESKYHDIMSAITSAFGFILNLRIRRMHAPYFVKKYLNDTPGNSDHIIEVHSVSQFLLDAPGFGPLLTSDEEKMNSIKIWLRHTCDLEFNVASDIVTLLESNADVPALQNIQNAIKTQVLLEIALWEYLSTSTPPGMVQLIGLKEFQKLTPLTIAKDINKESGGQYFVVGVPESLEEFMDHCMAGIPGSATDESAPVPEITKFFYKIAELDELRAMIEDNGTLENAFSSISEDINATIIEVNIYPRPDGGEEQWLIMFQTDYECTYEGNLTDDCRVSHGLNTVIDDFGYIPIYEHQYAKIVETLSGSVFMGAIHLDEDVLENQASEHLRIQSEQSLRQGVHSEIIRFTTLNTDADEGAYLNYLRTQLSTLPLTDNEEPVFFEDATMEKFAALDSSALQEQKPGTAQGGS